MFKKKKVFQVLFLFLGSNAVKGSGSSEIINVDHDSAESAHDAKAEIDSRGRKNADGDVIQEQQTELSRRKERERAFKDATHVHPQ